jgi:hypothetical protein
MEGGQSDAHGYGMMPFNGHVDGMSRHAVAMSDPRFASLARHREAIFGTIPELRGKRGRAT